jgi:hypothetical protein
MANGLGKAFAVPVGCLGPADDLAVVVAAEGPGEALVQRAWPELLERSGVTDGT